MEELAYVMGKVVRGIAGLAYAFGDTVVDARTEVRGERRRRTEREEGDRSADDTGR
ncbi:hypothetical protein [Streptomyces sp. NPDC012888]|uniref:hypothetical protein n=1 Tax=Streptomyces sp. NPDC012888 TaxID=3364855 RepID=UPI0036875C47